MPDLLAQALATEGLGWIALGAFLAGCVRGFAGFGTAMIYLPFAGQYLDPISAVVTMLIFDSIGPLPMVPRAIRDADWPDLRRLSLAMALTIPIGLILLSSVPAEVFRYTVSAVSLIMLAILLTGLRYSGRPSAPKTYAVGAAGGILGGAVGVPGPPAILYYMASPHPASVIRATTLLYLFAFEIAFFAIASIQDMLTWRPILLGAVLIPATMCGVLLGTWLFKPGQERLYRTIAYIIIAASAIRGLPLWG
jgi:uncharacterized membrane protein YfcA